MLKTYIKLSTAFVLALGSLVPLTLPSLANDDSTFSANKSFNADSQTICTNDIPGQSPTLPVTSNRIVCGPIADFAHGAPFVDTTGLPKYIDRSCESADCLRYKAHLIDKAEKAYEKAQAKAEKAQAKAEKARH